MKKTFSIFAVAAVMLLSGCRENYIAVGSNWNNLNQLKPEGETFQVSGEHGALGNQYKIGEPIKLSVSSARSGQLWVVAVDPKDEVELIYPNHKDRNNHIRANQMITLPAADSSWDFAVDGPAGPMLIAYIVTTGETRVEDVLGAVDTKEMDKAIRLVDRRGAWGIARQIVNVKEQ
jgi:hypothetical protein